MSVTGKPSDLLRWILEARAGTGAEPPSVAASVTDPELAARLADTEKRRRDYYDRALCQALDYIDLTAREHGEEGAEVIELRFLDGMEWKGIARKVHYSVRRCHELAGRALAWLDGKAANDGEQVSDLQAD